MSRPRLLRPGAVAAGCALAALSTALALPVRAIAPGTGALTRSPSIPRSSARELASGSVAKMTGATDAGEPRSEVLEAARQWAEPRSLPAAAVPPGALDAARAQAERRPRTGGTWREVTTKPYNSDDPHYADPYISGSGGGSGDVAGRVSALAIDGPRVYAGGADGGVWRSTDGGNSWTPLTDGLPTTSVGSLAVDRRTHALWLGTGEANTSSDGFLGDGAWRSVDHGDTWRKVGGGQLDGTMISAIAFDGRGHVFVATSSGVYRRPVTRPLASPWTQVLLPGTPGPYGFTFANDVDVQPGSRGRIVIADLGWREGGTDYNGFYVSRNSGARGSWRPVAPAGAIDAADLGRASFAYAADGSRLYAVVESVSMYKTNPESALMGVFVSRSASVAGPWKAIASYSTLAKSKGSALALGQGYAPGIQAWYNQTIGVDPHRPDHVYVGLEEVYETRDGGSTWKTVGPYWNFPLPCWKLGSSRCPPTTHPDQHAIAFGGGSVWLGNDGGVYRRSLDGTGGWADLNARLRTLQYYDAQVGAVTGGGLAYWGGMQDNGASYLLPGASTMVSPFGGDGGEGITDAANAKRSVQEYVNLDMWLTTNGGRSDGTTTAWREISPSCDAFLYTPTPCDPNARFTAPFAADPQDPNGHWVAGGRYVWETSAGWGTQCSSTSCDWSIVHDTGAANSITALALTGTTIYAGYCGNDCNPEGPFTSGIDTNYGGTWHTVAGPSVVNGGDPLPQRYLMQLVVDPADDAHVFALYGGYSRRWIPGSGVGHVFESTDGGANWTDISGDLPDAPADDLVISNGKLVVATDVGVFVTDAASPGTYLGYGRGLPNAVPAALTTTPGGGAVVVATHGRGIWSVQAP